MTEVTQNGKHLGTKTGSVEGQVLRNIFLYGVIILICKTEPPLVEILTVINGQFSHWKSDGCYPVNINVALGISGHVHSFEVDVRLPRNGVGVNEWRCQSLLNLRNSVQ